MPGKPQLCWDACVYISLLTGENRKPEEMKKLYEIEQMVNDGRAIIFSSAVEYWLLHLRRCWASMRQRCQPDQRSQLLLKDQEGLTC